MGHTLRILGLDPGLHHTGWGVLEVARQTLHHHAHGVIHTTPSHPLERRLSVLYQGLDQVITTHQPHVASVEETFVNTNAASSLKLGLARGVVLLAPGMHRIPVSEYGANHIKKTVVGVGHATKDQVALMVRTLLNLPHLTQSDSTDALAAAICHAHHQAVSSRIPQQAVS